jgi:ribosomal protection tetracycline resistance protein
VRVYGGSLSIGDICGDGRVKRLRKLTPKGEVEVKSLLPGEVGVAAGITGVRAGDWIGLRARGRASIAPPILQTGVSVAEKDIPALRAALARMQDEQPTLDVSFEPVTRRFNMSIMGDIHAQVIEQELRESYGVAAELGEPSVLYRETPRAAGEGGYNLRGSSPWYSAADFRVEPGEPGSGVVYVSEVSTDFLYLKYQRDVEIAVREALREGLSGWPVTDVVVRLTGAQMTTITRPGSKFRQVVPLGLFEALAAAGTDLLEPVMEFEAACDERHSAKLLYELSLMRAEAPPPAYAGGTAVIRGLVPVATSYNYTRRMRELTGGRGVWRAVFHGWKKCPEGTGRTRPRTTPDPLNKSLFMDYLVGRVIL